MARQTARKQRFLAYNFDTGKTQEIGFEDLQVGDYVVIGLYDNEKAQAQTETVHAESVERMRQNLCRIEKNNLQSANMIMILWSSNNEHGHSSAHLWVYDAARMSKTKGRLKNGSR